MTRYIGLSGYARSGKDTVAGILAEEGWHRYAFADKLKLAVRKLNPIVDINGWDDVPITLEEAISEVGLDEAKERYPEYRRLLQVMGTEVGRDMFGDNFWVEQAFRGVQHDKAIFTDCRFPNEAQAIVERGGEVWRIRRPGFGPINGHASEISLDSWEFDRVIENDGDIAALRTKVLSLVNLEAIG
mgnify:CR=1 FL=1